MQDNGCLALCNLVVDNPANAAAAKSAGAVALVEAALARFPEHTSIQARAKGFLGAL